MKYRRLRHSNALVSEIGLGCASYWAKKIFSETQAQRIVHCALDLGINAFDTGSSYAAGHAEIRLGRALRNVSARHSLFVSSKVGTRVGHYGRLYKDFSPSWIHQSVRASLKRLGLSHLPVLFLHGPNPEDFNDEVFQALADLRQKGLVGMTGVNSFDDRIIHMAVESGHFQCIMTDFNVLKPERARLLQRLDKAELDVFVAAALAGGLYSRAFYRPYRPQHLWYWARALVRQRAQLAKARKLAFLNQVPGWSAVQLALAYVLQNPHCACALAGTTSEKHLRELAAVSGRTPPAGVMKQIEAIR